MKTFIKKNWKPIAFWSGLGGLLFGGAIYAYKKGYVGNNNPVQPLPPDAGEIILQTTAVQVESDEDTHSVRSEYHLQLTPFRIYSIMDKRRPGHPVYFITPNRFVLMPDGRERTIQTESFYAMVGIPRFAKRRDLIGHVRKDSQVVFHICLVGGSTNGIPTGEKVISQGKLSSWNVLAREA